MSRVQILSILAVVGLLLWTFELMRSCRLKEQYALTWVLAEFTMLAFAVKRDLIDSFGRLVGIAYSPTAFLVVAMFFVVLILMHFSMVISRLAEQNRGLAQRMALMAFSGPHEKDLTDNNEVQHTAGT